MGHVLRGFLACDVLQVRLGENLCAALPIEKIAHLGTENSVYKILSIRSCLADFALEPSLAAFLLMLTTL